MSSQSTGASNVADSLLAGKGYSPDYGLVDSNEEERGEGGKNRWFLVSISALTACIASLVTGMSLSYSSIVIQELSNYKTDNFMYIHDKGVRASIIGVSCSKLYSIVHWSKFLFTQSS